MTFKNKISNTSKTGFIGKNITFRERDYKTKTLRPCSALVHSRLGQKYLIRHTIKRHYFTIYLRLLRAAFFRFLWLISQKNTLVSLWLYILWKFLCNTGKNSIHILTRLGRSFEKQTSIILCISFGLIS